MRVFGIDCGTECTGYGIVEVADTAHASRLRAIAAGGIVLSKRDPLPVRLFLLLSDLAMISRGECRKLSASIAAD